MPKTFRKFIRNLKGDLLSSPRFAKKKDADEWYSKMKRQKGFAKHGLKASLDGDDIPTFGEFSKNWLVNERMIEHPMATYATDEQRLRLHLLPVLAECRMDQITTYMLRDLIKKSMVTQEDPKNPGLRVDVRPTSIATKTRLKALLSAIFKSAIQRDDPLMEINPVAGVLLSEGRRKKGKSPTDIVYLTKDEDCIEYLRHAKDIGNEMKVSSIFVFFALSLMTGARKSEALGLKWAEIDFEMNQVIYAYIIEQASMSRQRRTKGGEETSRGVAMPAQLRQLLLHHKATSAFNKPSDFVLCNSIGDFLRPRDMSAVNEKIVERLGKHVTIHGLRHSFGRMFAARSGNMKALQQILGHATLKTTEVYSNLASSQMQTFKETVSFDLQKLGAKSEK